MLDLLDGGVTQMIDHLEMVTKVDTLVNVKDVFQKMALDVIARLTLKDNINAFHLKNCSQMRFWHRLQFLR